MIARRIIGFFDERLGSSAFLRAALKKVFPDHWAFMLGEICVYAFLILVITGTYIAFFFTDTDTPTVYHGDYAPLSGRWVPESYASVLNLSFAVPLGLLIRQMHHWAALLFMGAIMVHMARVFFTGAFRKPREINWLAGFTMLLLAMGEGFLGYSLPGDLLSGLGLRIAYSVAQSIPFIGDRFALLFFGGTFPSSLITQRLYLLHVWLIPIIFFGVLSLHLGLVWRQHHTQFSGTQETEENVVGSHLWPHYALKSLALFVGLFAVLAFLGGFFTINPIWIYGPYEGWKAASPAQPDWYVGWLDGSLRLGPALAVHLFGHTIPPLFWSGILMPLVLFGGMSIWPFVENSLTRDTRSHHIAQMPYDAPWRLGLGVAVITLGTVLGFAGSDDIQARYLQIEVQTLMIFYRIAFFTLPLIFGAIATMIGFELRARHRVSADSQPQHLAELRRNADGGFEAVVHTPSSDLPS